ncbi:MAG: PQQ-dependent sugar dehydrogenase, partial [Caldilineaceae bacterium]
VAAATVTAAVPAAPAFQALSGGATGISAPALGLPAASDGDGWLIPRGGLCVQRLLPDNKRGITSLAFAPDGRLFLGLDSNLAGEVDPLILYDAYHPSRSVAVIQPGSTNFEEIFVESTRITGMDWHDGTLYISRSGEVGRIVDGGEYEPLAGGFAVNSQLFHANNGLVVSGGWLYVSAGGVMDGYSEGPIVGIGEGGAQALVSGGNPYAARIVRAPLDSLLASKSISAFSTAARGVRNPYGITADPAGGIWFTDNGATNLPDDVSAGDEVNLLAPATISGDDSTSPYYGFPLALTGAAEWYSDPAITLPNTSAPTGITWALGTIYFAQYGKNPGLYRVGVDGTGTLVAERLLLGWPILALATAPDGALWMGMGDGGLFRITSGCG